MARDRGDERQARLIWIARKPFLTAPDIREIVGCGKNKAYRIMRYIRDERAGGVPFLRGAIEADVFWSALGTTSDRYIANLLQGTKEDIKRKED